MPTPYPYTPSGGPIVAIVQHLRRSFPAVVDASTLKKLGIAPKNESYVIGVLKFIGLLDDEGKKNEKAGKVFLHHEEAAFQKAFSELVKSGYHELFALHGDAAWELDSNGLISFFRQSAESSLIVGQRQANTFRTLSALAGHAEITAPKAKPSKKAEKTSPKAKSVIGHSSGTPTNVGGSAINNGAASSQLMNANPFGLSVRIEVNLPASADQETYDRIFQSIRKNLIERGES